MLYIKLIFIYIYTYYLLPFYHYDYRFKKKFFIKPCLLLWCYKSWEYIPLGLYSVGVINLVFSVGDMFKHWTQLKFLSITLYYAYAIFGSNQRGSLKYMLLENMTMIKKIKIIILVIWNCCIGNSNAMHTTTMSSHVLKRFYQEC